MKRKIYTCCICHNMIMLSKPIRLVHQVNDDKDTYRRFHTINNYDFCPRCFKTFKDWIKKYEKEGKCYDKKVKNNI